MQKIAEKIISEAYGIDQDQVVLTSADFGKLIFKGYNFMDWNQHFKLSLKITPKLEFKHELKKGVGLNAGKKEYNKYYKENNN